LFKLAHQGQHAFAEVFDFFLEVQKPSQDEIHTNGFVGDNALGNLLGSADQVGAEAVVVLDQILKARRRPVTLTLR